MAKIGKRPLDDEQLEGGGAGAGISGTKWSNMPSLKGNSSMMDDLLKIKKDTSSLKGNAKKVADDAKDRAITRTGVRAAGTGAVAAGAKMAASDASAEDSDSTKYQNMSGPAGMGEILSGKGMAKGGSASSRADGIAQRGKTKGTFVMCGGGMTKR